MKEFDGEKFLREYGFYPYQKDYESVMKPETPKSCWIKFKLMIKSLLFHKK